MSLRTLSASTLAGVLSPLKAAGFLLGSIAVAIVITGCSPVEPKENESEKQVPSAHLSGFDTEGRALNGDVGAAEQLAMSFLEGEGVQKDTVTGLAWLALAQGLGRRETEAEDPRLEKLEDEYSRTLSTIDMRRLKEKTKEIERFMSGVLAPITINDIPSEYRKKGKREEYTLHPRTEMVVVTEQLGRGATSSRTEIYFAKLDPQECEQMRNKKALSEHTSSYGLCIMRLATILGDPSLCAHIEENATGTQTRGFCVQWVTEQSEGDLAHCFLIQRPSNLEVDASAEESGSFSDCISRAIQNHPTPKGCALLGKTLKNVSILSDECLAKLAQMQPSEALCSQIVQSHWRDECYFFLAKHTNDKRYCERIERDANNIKQQCLAGVVAESKGAEGCVSMADDDLRDLCYYNVALEKKDYRFCDAIVRVQHDSQAGFRSQGDCYSATVTETENVEYCRTLETDSAKQYCYGAFSLYPKKESECARIEERFAVARGYCFYNLVDILGRSACMKIDPKLQEPDNRFMQKRCLDLVEFQEKQKR